MAEAGVAPVADRRSLQPPRTQLRPRAQEMPQPRAGRTAAWGVTGVGDRDGRESFETRDVGFERGVE
jgi:hypothetical protein